MTKPRLVKGRGFVLCFTAGYKKRGCAYFDTASFRTHGSAFSTLQNRGFWHVDVALLL